MIANLSLAAARALVRDEALWARGEGLYERERVVRPARRGRLLLASVEGSEAVPYAVRVEPPLPPMRRWAWGCTCPFFEIYGGPCKHNVALLLQWVHEPESFREEASLDERVAGTERARWLALIRDTLHEDAALQRLLALEPERLRPLGRALNLAPYAAQLRYAVEQCDADPEKQRRLIRGLLESAAGYLRIGDAANAARLTTLLLDALLVPRGEGGRSNAADRRLRREGLTLMEAAALDAMWSDAEQATWLAKVMMWWEAVTSPALADRLLDLLFHCHRQSDRPRLERWLRGLLRRPRSANQLSGALWRERVLAFLLALYDATGQDEAFLELCWEEGRDALAAQKLVEGGNVAAAVRLAAQGLGSSNAHREVVAALMTAGASVAAQQVAEAGLRYRDPGRGALLGWLAGQALARGEQASALALARESWAEGASLERYRLLRAAAQGTDGWGTMRRALHAALEQAGSAALLVEILHEEGLWLEATTLLPATGARRESLTDSTARGLASDHPGVAIDLLFDLADLRTVEKSRAAYARAAHALLAARSLASATGHDDHFNARLQRFLDANTRRPALRDEVERALG